MPEPYHLTDLTIVGYDDRLTDEMVPMVVSPVFSLGGGEYLFAPYTIKDSRIFGGQRVAEVRFEQLFEQGSLTKLPSPLDAIPDYELWVDLERDARYEPIGEVSMKLKLIAAECVAKAKEKLGKNDYDEADRLCRRAFCANERLVEALVIRALVADLKGEGDRYRPIIERLIEDSVSPASFQDMVEGVRGRCISVQKQEPGSVCSKMSNMATVRPRELQPAA